MKVNEEVIFGPILILLFFLVAIVPFVMALEATQINQKEGTKIRLEAIRSLLEKADEEGILIEEGKRVEFEVKAREIENKLEETDEETALEEIYEEAGKVMREIRKIVYPDSNESRKG